MKRQIFIVITALILATSCSKNSIPAQSFSIGKGGGFTGRYDEYLLKSNGEVYNISNGQSQVLFRTLGKQQTKAIFKQFDQINITAIDFSHPGNMTSYIRCELNNKTYEVKWGDSSFEPPQKVLDFFETTWVSIRPK